MAREFVNLDREGHLAVITLNRPDRLNALGAGLVADLHDTLDEIQRDREVWSVILTGAGRGFCAGGDVQNMGTRTGESAPKPTTGDAYFERTAGQGRALVELSIRLRELRPPVIAAVNGAAAGAGMSLALAADVRVASEQARFTMAFVKRGYVPDTGGTHLLPRLVGPGIAAELILTGRIIDAATALQLGIVNRVVPHDQLMASAREIADEMLANPPVTVAMAKQALYRGLLNDLRTSIDYESQSNVTASRTEDWSEAVRSFLEKRAPVFQGR